MTLQRMKTGGKVKLSQDGLGNDFNAAAGWDPAKRGANIDLDTFALVLGGDMRLIHPDYQIDFRHKKSPKNPTTKQRPIKHGGDDLTGRGSAGGDDETIELHLDDLPPEAAHVVVGIFSYSGHRFGDVQNAFFRVYRPADRTNSLAYYDLSSNGYDHTQESSPLVSAKAAVFGLLSRTPTGIWGFTAGGEYYNSSRELYAVYGARGV